MKELVPLVQTLLWVGLISAVLYRYHRSIEALITSLRARINSGGGVKVGPVELVALARPLDPEQQVKKLDEEVAQITKANEAAPPGDANVAVTGESIRSIYLRAEDLALREVQFEYQVTIGRQIELGSNLEFDGAFAKNGTLHVVEVKYSDSRPLPRAIIERTITRLFSRMRRLNWKNVRIIFVVVFGDSTVELDKERQRIADATSEYEDKIDIRCYHLSDLAKKFGMTP